MAKEKGEVVGTVRHWQPATDASLPHIHGAIDSWDRAGDRPAAPPVRDYAAIEAAVDRITRRVKTRKVTVTETVTEYVDEEVPAAEAKAASATPADLEAVSAVAKPVDEPPKKLGFFARRKAAKEAKLVAEAPPKPESTFKPVTPAPAAPATRPAAGAADAWDPGNAPAARPVSPPKPLQSKAAKRTAKKSAKKASKKKR